MPNFQPSSFINFTGDIAGSPSTTVRDNAKNAFDGTVEIRNVNVPTNNATIGTITSAATADGNVVITVPVTYTQSTVKADGVIVYYAEGATGANAKTNDHKGFSLDTDDSSTVRNVQFTLKPSQQYNFSVRAYRRSEGGRKYTAFSAVTAHTSTAGNYTGTVKGVPAVSIATGGAVGGNLVTQSENLSSWVLGNSGVSPGILYLDGSTQFWKFYETVPNSSPQYHDIYSNAVSVTTGDTITASMYVMAAERNRVSLYLDTPPWSPNAWPQANFNISAGVLINKTIKVDNAGIYEVGNIGASKVYRIYLTTVPATVSTNTYLATRTLLDDNSQEFLGSPGFGIYATRAQITKNVLSDYIKTTTTAIQNTAKTTDAFNETIKYRQDVSPSSDPAGLSVTQTATPDGNVVYKLAYTYSPGSIPADLIITYVKEGGGTISPSVTAFSTNAVSGDISFVLKPNTNYRFGAQAARRTERGLLGGNIISTADISPTAVSNFTGSIAGSPAATVAVNATSGATAFTGTSKYRTSGAPTNLVVPTGVTTTSNSNATKNIRVSWAAYTQGANQADVIGLFYRKDNLIPTYIDSCIVMNVNVNTPAYYEFLGVNPTDPYSFGIAAGRRTESGIEWGLINTTYGIGPFYLYGDDLAPVSPNVGLSTVTNITNDFTPNGEPVFLVTDADTVNSSLTGWGSNITAPGVSTRFLAEAFIKQNTTANIPNGLLQVFTGNTSYRNVIFSYATGAVLGTTGPSISPETYTETITSGSSTWYRIGVSAIMSPDVTLAYAYFYPALFTSPSATAISPDLTGSGTIGGVMVRRVSNTNTGFDWTAITADSAANFTGNIDGSPAAQVRAAAAQGAAVYTNFNANNDRNNTVPTNPTVSPDTGAIAHVINTDGSADLSFDWQYSPSTNVASANNIDGFIVYVRSSLSSSTYTMNTTPAEETTYTVDSARRAFILSGVPANRYYTFGVRAYRSVDSDIDSSGTKVSSIIQPSDVTQNPYLPTANVAFAGNITGTIDGSPANIVRTHASSAFTGTANYRQDVSPSSDPSIGVITQSATADGNVVVKVPFTYSPGSIPADFILVYAKENGGTISPAVQAYPTNPVTGDMSFVLKPSTTYRFGVQAVRRTESGLKGGNILSSADTQLTSPNYTGLIAGVPSNTVTTVVSNFNSSNDRNGTTPTAPTLTNTLGDYSPIILNTDGTCDIEFNWSYTNGSPQAANNVDGFIVYVQSNNYPNNYTFTGSETSAVIPVANASSYGYTFKNLPSHQWHNMGVRAYRAVDSDVTSPAPNVLYSSIVQSTYNNSRGITSTAKFPVGLKTHISSSTPTWDNVIPNDDYIAGAGWIKQNAVVIQSATELAPDGKTFAYELQDSGSVSPDLNHNIYRGITPVQGKYFVFKGFVKRKGADRGIYIRFGSAAFGGALRNFQFEISPLSMAFPGSGAGHGAIRPLENGWYEFFTAYPVTSPNNSNIQLMITRNGALSYAGASPDGMYFANLAAYNVDGIIGVSPGLPSVMDVVGSTWYDTTTSSLKIWNGSRWIESSTVGATFGSNTSNITGLSGDGVNRVLARYSGGFDIKEYDASNDANKYVIFPATRTSPGVKFASISVGTPADAGDKQIASGFYGTNAIKITSDGTGTHTTYFSTSSTTYNMPIDPNSRWILSAKMWTGSPTPTPFPLPVTIGVRTAVSPNTGYFITSPISSIKTWTDLSGVLNLTNDSSTSGLLFTTIGNTNGSPTVWFDGLMLEKQVGPGTTPSKWVKSTQSGAGTSAVNPAKIGGGALFNSVTMNQGDGNLRSIVNGLLLGYARDGDVISFSPAYTSAPSIIWLPGAKVTATGIPADASATYEAINVTTTGFTSKLKLTGLAPTVSPVTETYGSGGAVNTVISPSGGGANITADYVINKGNSASEAWDDKYTYNYTVSVTNSGPDSDGTYIPGKITINGYARIASGWVQVFTNVVSGSFNAASVTRAVSTTFTLDGVIQSPTAGQYEFAVDKGFNTEDVGGGLTAFSSVTYNIAGAVTQISATSTNSASVPYLVTATGTGN